MRGTFDTIATALLVVCALSVTGLAVRREFFPSRAPSASGGGTPRYLANWRSIDSVGIATGSVFVHYPLPIHRFSHQAAKAVECATRQGRRSMRPRWVIAGI